MDEEPRVFRREPKSDELALGYAWGADEKGDLWQLKGVSEEDRATHFYVIGASGTGKTKFLEYMIGQDIANGAGFGVIDPHGDLIEAVKERLALSGDNLGERVVLIDPTDEEKTVSFNPLELTGGMKTAALAEELISIFRRIWESAWGDRMGDILRNALVALIENERTLDELVPFLTDGDFRAKLVSNVRDEQCRDYFRREFDLLNPKTRREWITSTTNKVRALLADERVREIFFSPKSSFNFREIMDSGKILLVKLDKGRLKDASDLLGSLILSKIQMAAFARTDVRKRENRKRFYLYIDEFQNFAADSFKLTLSEASKYGLSLVVAHQNLAQLPHDLKASVLGNCLLQAYFRVSRLDAELLAKEGFGGVGDISPWEEKFQLFQSLPRQVCLVKNKAAGGIVLIRVPDIPDADEGMDEREFELAVREARIGEKYLRERKDIERVTGVEPVSRPWQGRIIAAIRYPPALARASSGGQARITRRGEIPILLALRASAGKPA